MSLTLIRGLQGKPSLSTVIFLEVTAHATKSFKTKSNLNLLDIPHAVANLSEVIVVSLLFKFLNVSSDDTLDFAYAVSGFNSSISVLEFP